MRPPRRTEREASFAGDIRLLLELLRAKRSLIALCVLAGAALGLFYIAFSPKLYVAKAVIQIEPEDQKAVRIDGASMEELKLPEVLKTYEQSVVSSEVLLRLIENHGLKRDPTFLPEVPGNVSPNALQEALARHITAKIRRGTRLIDISVTHRNPLLAQRIAELLVEEFTQWNSEARHNAGQLASRFLLEQAERLNARLAKSQQALQAYKEQNEGVSLEEKQNITVEKLKELNLRVTEAKAARLKLESDCVPLSKAAVRSPGELLAIPGIANAPAIVDMKKSIGEKEAVLATLSQRYKAEHPKFIGASSELENLKAGLDAAILKAADILSSQYQAAILTEEKLEQALREQQKLALAADKISIGYAALAREVESDRALYESVLTRLKETDITKDITRDAVRLIARPLVPDRPAKPQKKVVLALSILAGLTLGCSVAFASHAADRSLKTLHDAEARLGLRSLGEIPRLAGRKGNGKNSTIFVESDFAAVESFRTLRTSLSLISQHAGWKTFLFTSAHPAEGKTFCAINCAISFAQLGLKTLLIDADFRRPQIHEVFFNGTALRAVNNSVAGDDWQSAIQRTHIPNLSVLAAANCSLNSAECIVGSTFEQFIKAASAGFDRVIVDSAPVHLVSDTLLFAKHVHSVCLVIHAGQTPADDVLRAADRLAEAGAPLAGFVWNQVEPRNSYYYSRALASRGAVSLLS